MLQLYIVAQYLPSYLRNSTATKILELLRELDATARCQTSQRDPSRSCGLYASPHYATITSLQTTDRVRGC